ncbi:hypothetical protein FPZ12_031530 [Amycolatopsis acidicola]|uniref:Uncharacterized protein n=1 Tax=Amycolatopsis acidicola TaxID=2596893 RepID=A0A5N0UY55_9PSEU|nr:hypothetical protein [Amycolatopsis acidicola]KAA9154565.1 hypothetical protein FPZ12_031530 [Amycolatopsis acidicola]
MPTTIAAGACRGKQRQASAANSDLPSRGFIDDSARQPAKIGNFADARHLLCDRGSVRSNERSREMETTGEEVRETFLITPQAVAVHHRWEHNKDRLAHGVIATMRDHVTRAIYDCSLSTFDWIEQRHVHPLGNIAQEDIEHIVAARDWYPNFAFVHIFHLLMEQLGRPPLWSEYEDFCNTPDGLAKIGKNYGILKERIFDQEITRLKARFPRGKGLEHRARTLASASLNWRAGNAYYGFMRDMYTAVALRSRGLDVRVHPIADALFRTDAWSGNNILSIYVGNPAFRESSTKNGKEYHKGRKMRVDEILAESSFCFHTLALPAARRHGVFHFPSDADLDKVEQELRRTPGNG